jgi:SP family general alpha glucoside:H+ symporter-like MFS transporter
MTFAVEVAPGVFSIPAYWQSAWNASFNVMSIFGSLFAGWVQDRFGRRVVFIPGIVSATVGIALAYTANDAQHFLGGKICTGFAVGAIVTATQTYVSEITPLPMRGIALSVNTIMMVSSYS